MSCPTYNRNHLYKWCASQCDGPYLMRGRVAQGLNITLVFSGLVISDYHLPVYSLRLIHFQLKNMYLKKFKVLTEQICIKHVFKFHLHHAFIFQNYYYYYYNSWLLIAYRYLTKQTLQKVPYIGYWSKIGKYSKIP